ncbi:MAG: serine hydrolase domain-containing protein [Flavisolibacter sp.]
MTIPAAQNPASGMETHLYRQGIKSLLQKQVHHGKTPSVQYILFNTQHTLARFSFGLADIGNNKKVEELTTYNAFSVTKTFTALAIMHLGEQKMLDIDERVISYLPEFPYPAEITIRQLLQHRSGIPNPIPLKWVHLSLEKDLFNRDAFFKNIFNRNPKLIAPPNAKYHYSNLGYVVLGQLIEKVTRKRYENFLQEYLISVFGWNSNELGFEIPNPPLHAKGYQKRLSFGNLLLGLFIDKRKYLGPPEGGWVPFKPFYVNGPSYGGLIGTSGAFVKYLQKILNPEDQLLPPLYKQQLFAESPTGDREHRGVCLSWFPGILQGHRYLTHAGGGGGYYCEIRMYPDEGLGSVIFFNRSGFSDERFLSKVDILYFNSLKENKANDRFLSKQTRNHL